MKNPPFTLIIAVSLQLAYFSSSCVCLFFSLYFFCMYKVVVMREVSSCVCLLNKPGGGKIRIQSLRVFFLCQYAFQVRTKQSGRKNISLFQCQFWIQIQMRRCIHRACRINRIVYQTRRCRVGGSLLVRLILMSCLSAQIWICLVLGLSTRLLVFRKRPSLRTEIVMWT